MADARSIQISAADYKISRRLFARLWRLTKPYWIQKEHWPWWLLMGSLLVMTPAWAIFNYWLSHLMADLTNAIIAKQEHRYTQLFWMTTWLGLGAWVIQTLMGYLDSRLDVHWRQWLTDWMVGRYLHKKTYYDIAVREDLDNPDQRMQEDIAPFVTTMANIPRKILSQVMGLITSGVIVASVSTAMTTYVVGYAVLSTIVTLLLYAPMIKLNFVSTVAEADLRYGILHVRDNAETVAFYRGEGSEHQQIRGRLGAAITAKLAILIYQLKMNWFSQGMGLLWTLAPFFLITPLFFEGKIEYGAIAMATTAAAQMLQSLTLLNEFIPTVTSMAPRAVRLAQILERFDQMDAERARDEASQLSVERGPLIAMRHASLETPGGEQKLVRELDFELGPGEHMVIIGQTGVGKSSLLRAMAGLWRRGTGKLVMPPPEDCLFLPQRPYMILADLRSQLLYPRGRTDLSDADLQTVLEQVCLPHLLEKHGGLDAIRDWGKVLSLGEQQRIGFARVLVSASKFVFLDEATSAVDIETEARLYRLLAESGATFISVGHRETILRYHDKALRLYPGGGWEIVSALDAARPRGDTTVATVAIEATEAGARAGRSH